MRAGAARGCRPKRSSSAPPTASPIGRRPAAIRGATRRRTPAHGVFDFASWDPAAGRQPSRRRQRAGASTISSATAGNGRSTVFAPFPGFTPMPSYPGVLRRLLRRRALRDEGRVAGHRARAAAADVPQLVPAALSVRLCDVPLRESTVTRADRRPRRRRRCAARRRGVRRRRPPLPALQRRGSCRRTTSTTRSARRSSTRSASCRGTAHARRAAPARRARAARSSARPSRLATHRRARCRATARSSRALIERGRRRRAADRAPVDVSASGARRGRSASVRRRRPTVVHRTRRRTRTGLDAAAPRRRVGDGRTLVLFLGSNIGNFDPPARRRVPAAHPRARSRRATRCCSAPTS